MTTKASLPEETRCAVREEVRHNPGETGGLIEIEMEYSFGRGRRVLQSNGGQP
jgi:hypothetical protein